MAHKSLKSCCPRCGYDLRGTLATWDEAGSCPLDGTCAECGLTFRWVDVFDPTREEPKWCVEYAAGRMWPLAKAMMGTFARSWLPWMFWKRLRLHHEVRLRRIAMYLIVLLLFPLSTLYVVVQSVTAIGARHEVAWLCSSYGTGIDLSVARSELELWQSFEKLEDTPVEYMESAVHFAQRLAVTRLPSGNRDGDSATESLTQEKWEEVLGQVFDWYEAVIADAEALQANPPHVTIGYIAAIGEAVFTPWSETSRGTIELPDETQPYPPPRDLYGWMPGAPWHISSAAEVLDNLVERSTPLLAWLILLTVYPLTFALLPITRRRARVRWRHFARIGSYSIAIPIFVFHLCVLSFAASLWHERVFAVWNDWIDFIVLLGPLPLALAWWYFAIRIHLRLPHPLLVTIVLAVLTPLAVGAAVQVSVWLVQLFAG